MEDNLVPRVLVRNEQVGLEDIRAEIVSLGQRLNEVVKVQPLAHWTDHMGRIRSGVEATAPVNFTVNLFARNYACTGAYFGGNNITINVGAMAQWGDIVETLLHELAHRMRPTNEVHSKKFWQLLSIALQVSYGVSLPTQNPPRGMSQYWRDWVAAERIRKQHSWAQLRPLSPKIQGTVWLYEKAA